MSKKNLLPFSVLILLFSFFVLFIRTHDIALFNPQGLISTKQRQLILLYVGSMLVIVIPTFFILFLTVFRYRDGHQAKYTPQDGSSLKTQLFFWSIPTIFLLIFALITWNSSHELDPYKSIQSDIKPVNIQVIALQWKWLFLYPDYGVATVNFLQFPQKTPLNFQLTADAPMSSFWIPKLGGQIYAMTGMSTQTHLMANTTGDFQGSDAEINGVGISGMRFTARSSTQTDFDNWIKQVKSSSSQMDLTTYAELAKPSENYPASFYVLADKDLYNKVIVKFMVPPSSVMPVTQHNMSKMEH